MACPPGNCTTTAGDRFDLDRLPEVWRQAPRRWGHPLHSLCSYFAMFPPKLAHTVISWLTEPGDTVYDPFSGRGTVALEAALLDRQAYSSDANPLACSLSAAKTVIPSEPAVLARIADLEAAWRATTVDVTGEPPEIRMLYSDGTLRQLVFLKGALTPLDPTDRFLTAMILGMLHGNHSRTGATRAFSISMPNTFAMAPRYVERYIAEHNLVRPDVDVFAMLCRRVQRLDLPARQVDAGVAWQQDATERTPKCLRKQTVRLVLASPPYLAVIKYAKYNWVRLWFLGQDWREVDRALTATSSLNRYVEFMAAVCARLEEVVARDGYLCLVIGDVRRPTGHDSSAAINLARVVWERVAEPLGWHLHGIVADELPEGHKVSRIWKNNTGRATRIDRLLLMSPTPTVLPPVPEPTWGRLSFEGEVAPL